MEQKESDHMDVALNQFSNLKTVIEIQSVMGTVGEDQPVAYSPMSSPLTLGSSELPNFVSTRALGQINIYDSEDVTSKIDLLPKPADFLTGVPLTSIIYQGDNAYFNDQDYILEGGGIILKQDDGETMKIAPPLIAENSTTEIILYYTIPMFTTPAGKDLEGDGTHNL